MMLKALHPSGCASALTALVMFFVGCASAPKPAPDTRIADEKAIREADAAWLKAVAAKDVDKALSFWVDDCITMEPGRPIVVGKEAVRKLWQDSMALPDMSVTWTTTQIVVAKAGDIAYQYGPYEFSMKDSKGKPVQERGKYLTVWRKQADGNWRVVIDTFNSDAPPPKAEKK